MTRAQVWAPLLVLAVAAFFRLWRLEDFPPGLHSDIGVNGLDARDVLRGQLAVFFPRNFGREPLFIYLQALLVGVAGASPFVMNFAAAIVGTLAVAASYRLALELFGWRVALFGALLVAVSMWSVTLSRLGLRASSLPLFVAVTLFFLWRTLRRGRRLDAALAGAVLGLSLYTYIAARMLPLLVAALCLLEWPAARRRWRELAIVAVVALLVAGPELLYFARHWEELSRRAWDVSVFNQAATEVEGARTTPLEALANTAGMFFASGDRNWRHNWPGRPLFDLGLAVLFVAGLGLALWRAGRESAYRWPLAWLVVMALPTALSHESPNFLRALSVVPAASLFPALVLGHLTRFRLGWAVGAAIVLATGVTTYRLYFDRWGPHIDNYWAHDGNLPGVAQVVQARPEPLVFISIDRRPTVLFLAPRSAEARWYREESAAVPVPARAGGDVLYVSARYAALKDRGPEILPGLERLPNERDPHGGDAFVAYRWPVDALGSFLGAMRPVDASMAPDFRLAGYVQGGRELRLFWQPLAASGPYDLYLHLQDRSGGSVAQSDVLAWPTDSGPRRDEYLITRHMLEAPPGTYVALAGVVRRDPADRAKLVGGPIGEVARIELTLP